MADASSSAAPPVMSEAKRKAEARKAKILARGGAGLAKLASTARGEEAGMLYDTATPPRSSTSTPAHRPATPSSATGSTTSSHLPPAPKARSTEPAFPAGSDPAADYQRQLESMMSMFGASAGGGPVPGVDDPSAGAAFQQLVAQMMGVNAGAFGSDPAGPAGLLGDVDPTADPPSPTIAGAGASPFGANPFFPPGGMPGLGGLGPGGMPGAPGAPPPKPSLTTRIFPLVHWLSIIAFWAFTLLFWEPRTRLTRLGGALDAVGESVSVGSGAWARWTVMGHERGLSVVRNSAVAQVPLFWAFITLELILQTTRFMLLRSPPPPPSFLTQYAPLIPPHIANPILLAARYLALASQAWKDGALLVVLYGLTVLWAGRG